MKFLTATKPISSYQFALFRIGFGSYLIIHFVHLVPYGEELFGRSGVVGDPSLNPLYGIFPNPLVWFDTQTFVTSYLVMAIVLSVLFTFGVLRRTTACLLWFIWASLFNRNNLISNPGIPYVGLILIFTALLPCGDRLSLRHIVVGKASTRDNEWHYPAFIYWTAWFLLAVGYSFSGLVKLGSPSWVNGEAIRLLLDNPLARPGVIRDLFLNLPVIILSMMTWVTLALEIIFLPMSFYRRTRFWIWLLLIGMHIGITLLVDFADLTLGMLMIHWFTLDPEWFRSPRKLKGKKNIVFFDGVCVMCNSTVKFLIEEDFNKMLFYAPLQGETFKEINDSRIQKSSLRSIVFVEAFGEQNYRIYTKSAAAIRILYCIGGFWKLMGWALFLIPKPLRDTGYTLVADHRYKWFGQYDTVCKIPDQSERQRILP